MSNVKASDLPKAEHDELACTYAALMLHDDGMGSRSLLRNWTRLLRHLGTRLSHTGHRSLPRPSRDKMLVNFWLTSPPLALLLVQLLTVPLLLRKRLQRKKRKRKQKMSTWPVSSVMTTSTDHTSVSWKFYGEIAELASFTPLIL